jgi:hypothetical protein
MRYSRTALQPSRGHLNRQIAVAWGLSLLSCCTVGAGHASPAISPSIDMTVVSAGTDGHLLSGVVVKAIKSDGQWAPLGKTDALGHIHFSKKELRAGAIAIVFCIIFCHRTYFCGALVVAEGNFSNITNI